MVTTTTDLSAEISVFDDVMIRAALSRGLSSEEQDALAELIEALRVLIGDQDLLTDDAGACGTGSSETPACTR